MIEKTTTTSQLLLRFVITAAGLFAAQWLVPYIWLTLGSLVAGVFELGTSKDRRVGWVYIATSVFIAVVGYLSVNYWQISAK
jgi:hypothetical protein